MVIVREPQNHPAFPAALPSSSASSSASNTAPQIPYTALGRTFTKYIIHIFGSARYSYPSLQSMWQATLPVFITNILYTSLLPVEVGMSAMVLLFRYKDAVPHSVAYGDDAARLFLAAYIIAAKVISDADLESKGNTTAQGQTARRGMDFWFHVSQKRFPIEELRRMELELCRILRWDVQVGRETFARFLREVYRECEVGYEIIRVMEEEEREEERQQQQHVERLPPPPYCEAERDVRVVEIVHEGCTAVRRGIWQGESPMAQSQARTLIPSTYGMFHEDDEDRQRFGRMFEETILSPTSIG